MTRKILILDGHPEPDKMYDAYFETLQKMLETKGDNLRHFRIREMKVSSCVGCWDCWVKTPGQCRLKDDQEPLLREAINSDLVIFTSPMIMGFPSSILKKSMDRFIPLLHPYSDLVQNESHHSKRYEKYPHFGFIVREEDDGDKNDLQILKEIAGRFALNFKSEIKIFATLSKPVGELSHEISSL